MVTVNESAYKSVKKTLTIKTVSIRARHNKHVHQIYMNNHIFSIGYTKTDQHSHYRR